jgi:hypothetical protein
MPIRSPVKPPGPTPTAIRSTAAQSTTSSTSASRRDAWDGRPPRGGSSRRSTAWSGDQTATAVDGVAVSIPRIT